MDTSSCNIPLATDSDSDPDLLNRETKPEATMAKAAVAAGADELLLELHYRPEEAFCDASQSLFPDGFMQMKDLRKIAEAIGRDIYNLENS